MLLFNYLVIMQSVKNI